VRSFVLVGREINGSRKIRSKSGWSCGAGVEASFAQEGGGKPPRLKITWTGEIGGARIRDAAGRDSLW
jgi:hypothetical protein